jgi:hypothetical protein
MDGYQIGVVLGKMIYWFIHMGVTIVFWIFGIRWIKA